MLFSEMILLRFKYLQHICLGFINKGENYMAQLHIHDSGYDSSRCDLQCQIVMDKTENSEITKVSRDQLFLRCPRIHWPGLMMAVLLR